MGNFINGQDNKERLLKEQIRISKRLSIKDFIGYGLAIIAIIVAIFFGMRNQQLIKTSNQINNYIQVIQQNNNYNELPKDIKQQIEKIANATGTNE